MSANVKKDVDEKLKKWGSFESLILRRLVEGSFKFGNLWKFLTTMMLIEELEEELADVAVYAFLLYCKMEEIKDALASSSKSSDGS